MNENVKQAGMQDHNALAIYQGHFLRETRDKIAAWIVEPKIKARFAEDMNDLEQSWRAYDKEYKRIENEQRNFLHSAEGRKWDKEIKQREERGQYSHRIGKDEIEWFDRNGELRGPQPGTGERQRIPKELREEYPESPLKKFYLPIKGGALTINDYRILLGVLHDGFTWHEGDSSKYICPELAAKGTMVDVLFWDGMWYKPGYQSLIKEALRYVERDIEDNKLQRKPGQSKPDNRTYEASQLHNLSISSLIKCGEGHTVEFKETLEYDVKHNQYNPNLNKGCLKTIAAFLNADGGTLLIGVKDNGEVTGIERDLQYVQRKNQDGFQQKLRSLIRSHFSPHPLGKAKVTFKKLAKGTVCRIDVNPASPGQVFNLDKDVYVREGNTTVRLDGRDLTDWIKERSQASHITAENENRQTPNGWGLRPVFPQNKIEWHKPEIVGLTDEELLIALYDAHSKWLEEVKIVCERGQIPLEQHLRKGLELAIKDKRVRDSNYETASRLLRGNSTGQDVLLFFVKRCPHAREALLKGELPPYPWRSGPADLAKQPARPGTSKPKTKPVRDHVFICYSRKDKRWHDDLQTHLKPYGSVTAWSDEQIAPGAEWFAKIKEALARTKVGVLLVTPDFLASDFIREHELTPLLKEAKKGNVCIIWIPVKACSYKETPLERDQAALEPAKPLAPMRANRDKAWVTICEKIKKAVGR